MKKKEKKPTAKRKKVIKESGNPVAIPEKSMTMEDTKKRGYKLGIRKIDDMELKALSKLPEGFSTADKVESTEKYENEFELGRLRNLLHISMEEVELKGKKYWILADPLNQHYELFDHPPG